MNAVVRASASGHLSIRPFRREPSLARVPARNDRVQSLANQAIVKHDHKDSAILVLFKFMAVFSMLTFAQFFGFLVAAVLITASPGPDNLMIT